MGLKTIAYYSGTTAVAIIIGLGVAYMISPGQGVDIATDNLVVPESATQESEGAITT